MQEFRIESEAIPLTKVVQISPATRLEGHSKLTLKVDDQGIVERGDWLSITPVRGIEKLAIGKTIDQVPKITSRVCGICPVAHTLASSEAIEASIGCEIPTDAKLLRIILHAANRLHSIALHNILILPDFYIPGTETKFNLFSREQPARSIMARIIRIREIGQTIGALAGGEAIHPSNPRVGGMYRNVNPQAKQKMTDLAKEGLVLAHEQMEFMLEVIRNMQNREFINVAGKEVPIPRTLGYHNQELMATAPMYGASSLDENPMWDFTRWKETRPWDWYMGEVTIDLEDPGYPVGGTTKVGTKANPRMEACNSVPTYDGQLVEVGPRARLTTFNNFTEKGTFAQHIARQLEYPECCSTILECLDNLDTSGKVLADNISQGDGSMGWATNEAPRGTDVHLAKVKDGRVLWYEMLVPTTWNLPTCSRGLTGAPWQIAEMVIRAYDPCISCATHMIVLDEKDRMVAQKLLQW